MEGTPVLGRTRDPVLGTQNTSAGRGAELSPKYLGSPETFNELEQAGRERREKRVLVLGCGRWARGGGGVPGRDLDDGVRLGLGSRQEQLGQTLAEVVEGKADHVEEVSVDALHQHASQRLDAVATGLVPEGGTRDTRKGGIWGDRDGEEGDGGGQRGTRRAHMGSPLLIYSHSSASDSCENFTRVSSKNTETSVSRRPSAGTGVAAVVGVWGCQGGPLPEGKRDYCVKKGRKTDRKNAELRDRDRPEREHS